MVFCFVLFSKNLRLVSDLQSPACVPGVLGSPVCTPPTHTHNSLFIFLMDADVSLKRLLFLVNHGKENIK